MKGVAFGAVVIGPEDGLGTLTELFLPAFFAGKVVFERDDETVIQRDADPSIFCVGAP